MSSVINLNIISNQCLRAEFSGSCVVDGDYGIWTGPPSDVYVLTLA